MEEEHWRRPPAAEQLMWLALEKLEYMDKEDFMKSVAYVYESLAYYGSDQETHTLIARAVARLPQEIIDFAIGNCVFMSVGRSDYGLTMPIDLSYLVIKIYKKKTR